VAGVIDDLPSCAELIATMLAEAEATLDRLAGVRGGVKDTPFGT
jgi:hypothetical protein